MSFSVLLPVYSGDRADYLNACLESVRQQTRLPAQVVVVVDGPIGEELGRTIDDYSSELPLTLVRLSENQGLAKALNYGLDACVYNLVARIDADDVALPERFELQLEYFRRFPEADIVGSFALEIDEDGQIGNLRVVPTEHAAICEALWLNPVLHPTVMYKKESILAAGGYDEKLRRRQDYELWYRCARTGLMFGNIDKPLLYYRFSSHTHKKQTPLLALQQAMIGYKGARDVRLAWWKRIACFIPFLRSLLPVSLQHFVYRGMRWFDPRRRLYLPNSDNRET